MYNENKLDEMSMILEYFMTLVPTKPNEGHLVLPNGCTVDYDTTSFLNILLRGDQLTVARVRGTQALRQTEDTAVNHLQGLIPVIEDWHARMSLVKGTGSPYKLKCTIYITIQVTAPTIL